MPGNSHDPLEIIQRLAESYRQIRFGPGVVGKTSWSMLALLGIWGIVLWRLNDQLWFDSILVGGGLIASVICVWWVKSTQKFAKENPAQALLDGAQLLEYQKFEAQVKGLPPLKSQPIKGPLDSLPNKLEGE